jgi:hypothetical protein
VTGWLAMCWTSLALAPMNRLIIVSPLSRTKLPRRGAKRCVWTLCRASENRPSPLAAVEERRYCLLQWAALQWRRPVNNKASGEVGQTPRKTLLKMSLGPRPREIRRPAKITFWTGPAHLVRRIVEARLYQVNTSTNVFHNF